ncbi:TniQ family protein [Burkholderia gladioli pv. gladioli]|uniref:TniQ family protein n=1 Tax=Burkholderia gladioli TaxID=28095 RepID=A0AAW3F0X2_BURGA|nr:TniQ family protein [Burkholderia gladioli]AJW94671.1 tniQ family protein [Burkholderia gladioli]ASD83710.1 hypothetical protein CEJ98_33255 [Burkholderia gladioli pv. gladioli]AWY51133.1 hypothetical protein A8H28_08025 [Burkholderia gladioli pv. gladioli]KGC14126.1 tniQ family protein [Burkholderia gladioli]MDJ1166677.1 TniQ family protein [Burkholderia gladioli pv. gladioli]
MSQALLIGVKTYPGESLSSMLLRTAEANALPGPGFVLRVAGIASTFPRLPNEVVSLARVCRQDPELIGALCPREFGVRERGAGPRRRYTYYGANVGQHHLLVGTCERVCPMCIRKFGYLPGVHAFTFVTACPYHQVRILDQCPACERAIDALRPRLHLCQCGFDLGGDGVRVSDEEMRVARLVCRRWQLHFLRETPPRCEDVCDEFNKLDLDDLLRVISFFCTLEAAGGWSRYPASRSKRVRDVAWRVERAGCLVRDWPYGLQSAISKVRDPLVQMPPCTYHSDYLGRLSYRLFTELPEPTFGFIHRAFISSAQRKNATKPFGKIQR